MFRNIWHIASSMIYRRRTGLDSGNIEHLRADLRFRLAIVEYAYFGKSGRRVARRLAELKSLIGDKATHRYLSTLDPDLRGQFVERIQGVQRELASGAGLQRAIEKNRKVDPRLSVAELSLDRLAPNVVSIRSAARRTTVPAPSSAAPKTHSNQSSLPADSGD